MSFNLVRVPEKGQVATSVSMDESWNSTPYKVDLSEGYSICASITESVASLEGTLKLQASNNCFKDNTGMELRTDAVWVDIPDSTVTLDGGNDSAFWNVTDVYYEAVRIVFTYTSGEGSGSFYFIAKRP